jgi:hypothetical protein
MAVEAFPFTGLLKTPQQTDLVGAQHGFFEKEYKISSALLDISWTWIPQRSTPRITVEIPLCITLHEQFAVMMSCTVLF